MNDQENIKRIHEWDKIRKEMEAGSGATKVDVATVFSGDKSSMASILQELQEELQSQGDAVAEYEKQDWDDPAEYISQGWCEGLEFAIKTIKRHNKGYEADQYTGRCGA